MKTQELKKAIDKWIDEQDMEMDNPLEPIKVASALKSELFKWELRDMKGEMHSPLDYTIIKALEYALGVSKREMEREE